MCHSTTLCCYLVKTVIIIGLESLLSLLKTGTVESCGPYVCFVLIPVSIFSQCLSHMQNLVQNLLQYAVCKSPPIRLKSNNGTIIIIIIINAVLTALKHP